MYIHKQPTFYPTVRPMNYNNKPDYNGNSDSAIVAHIPL